LFPLPALVPIFANISPPADICENISADVSPVDVIPLFSFIKTARDCNPLNPFTYLTQLCTLEIRATFFGQQKLPRVKKSTQ
jgi:hypothetical protein